MSMRHKIIYILALLFAFMQTFAQTTYTYDDLNRLTRVRYSNGMTISYTYDKSTAGSIEDNREGEALPII